MVIPNLNNDAHDGSLLQADNWLADWIPAVMAVLTTRRAGWRSWSRSTRASARTRTSRSSLCTPRLDNVVVTQAYDHYGLTRMYDDVLGVPPLNAAATHPGLKAAFGL